MLQSTHGALCQVHDKMWVSSASLAIFIYIAESAGTWSVQDIHVETKNQVLYSWISCDKYIIACHLNCWTSTWNWMGVSDQKERWTCSCRSIYRKWWSSRQILFKLYFRPCGASWNKYITWLFSLVFASQYLDRPQLQNAAWCRNFAVKLKVAL